ncbi:phosphonate ABC transporter ATP-binding protein, partial [Halobacteriales archaeon SW_7_68_16]
MAFVEIDGVSKSYGDVTALRDVSVSIPEGEFVVVLGASGAGKSTLLRCLNGLTTPDAGTITVAGTEITGPRDDVAMIFQQHNVIGQLSAYANALTGALHRTNYLRSLAGSYAREDEREALAALRTV